MCNRYVAYGTCSSCGTSGSLLAALKARGLATGLLAGANRTTSACWMFAVTVSLTERGVTERLLVLDLIFAFLSMLRSVFQLPHSRAELDAARPAAPQGPSAVAVAAGASMVAPDVAAHVHELWVEQQRVAEMRFRFQEQSEPIDYVESLSEELLVQPDEMVLTASFLFYEYDPELLRGVIALLAPDTCRVDVQDASFASAANETEEWFGVRFSREAIAPSVIQRWWSINAGSSSDVVAANELRLPDINDFIPADFTIKRTLPGNDASPALTLSPPAVPVAGAVPAAKQAAAVNKASASKSKSGSAGAKSGEGAGEAPAEVTFENNVQLVETSLPQLCYEMSPPTVLADSDHGRLWHKLDVLFDTPRASIGILFQSPEVYCSPARAAQHALFVSLLGESLVELAYPAGLAQLYYSLSNSRFGTELRVWGFSDKLFLLAQKMVDRLVTYDVYEHKTSAAAGTASKQGDPFDYCKERLIRSLRNENSVPLTYANSLRLVALQSDVIPAEQFLQAALQVYQPHVLCVDVPSLSAVLICG